MTKNISSDRCLWFPIWVKTEISLAPVWK